MNEPDGTLPVYDLDGELITRLRDLMREKMRNQLSEENLYWVCSGLVTGIVSAVRDVGLAGAIDRRLAEEGMPLQARIGISPAFDDLLGLEDADVGYEHDL